MTMLKRIHNHGPGAIKSTRVNIKKLEEIKVLMR